MKEERSIKKSIDILARNQIRNMLDKLPSNICATYTQAMYQESAAHCHNVEYQIFAKNKNGICTI